MLEEMKDMEGVDVLRVLAMANRAGFIRLQFYLDEDREFLKDLQTLQIGFGHPVIRPGHYGRNATTGFMLSYRIYS